MSRPSERLAPELVHLLSPARLAANRTNAQRSTGPRTVDGKATSAQNATKHGLLSQQLVLPGEDPAILDALTERLQREFAPETAVEELLIDDVASLVWRLQRAARVEVGLYAVGLQAPTLRTLTEGGEASSALGLAFAGQASSFAILSRYEVALVHRLRRALQELERLQAARASESPVLMTRPAGC